MSFRCTRRRFTLLLSYRNGLSKIVTSHVRHFFKDLDSVFFFVRSIVFNASFVRFDLPLSSLDYHRCALLPYQIKLAVIYIYIHTDVMSVSVSRHKVRSKE